MYLITLLRHGESEGNQSGVIQGQSDYPLTQTGVAQAEFLAACWKSEGVQFDRIITSPLLRASQTAGIIAKHLDIPVENDPDWMERNFGNLQGKNFLEVSQRNPPVDFFHLYEPIGGDGESQMDLFSRASRALQNILRHPVGSYLVVSHGGILNKALYVIMGITPQGHYNSPLFHFSNTGYAQFRYNPSSCQWAVINLNNNITSSIPEGERQWKID